MVFGIHLTPLSLPISINFILTIHKGRSNNNNKEEKKDPTIHVTTRVMKSPVFTKDTA
jgi:hypothetical protein